MIEIVRAGGGVTIQDLGRPGYAHLGVGRSGAADRGALRLANRLVGNAAGAAGLEITFGGLTFIARHAITVAVTGAAAPGPLGWGAAVTLAAGTGIEIGQPARGLRSYLAVRGGIEAAPVLGSRSTDALGRLGPAPATAGAVLALGRQFAGEISGDVAPPTPWPATLRVIAGPRADWFSADALTTLTTTAWTVRPESNRIGVRLDGPALTRVRAGELATEPTLPGALQIPPDGRPIVLGPDAPVTGGYPVLAVLADADLDGAGQLRPGDTVRFRV